MRRWGRVVSVLVAGAVVLAAVASARAAQRVVVTIKPIHSLLARLMQGVGEPVLLVEGAASPHAFALRPSGVRAIGSADLFVRVSPTLEPFTEKIIKTLPESVRVVTLVDVPGLTLYGVRGGGTFEAHEGDAHEEAARGNIDGHVWLDPGNAKLIVAHLADVLSARAPEHAQAFRANARALTAELEALTEEIVTETAPLKEKPFVVFHDAYQYFEKRFGLDAVGAITVSPEVPPSAKRLGELRERIRTLHAECVFAEPFFQPKLVAAVAEGTGARAGTLDAEGALLEPGAGLYFALMRNLAASLGSCLRQAS